MKVLIVGGFLGSGKTTLLLHLIEHEKVRSNKEVPVAVLENEIGSIGIDDRVIGGKGYAVTTMLSGCACCTLAGDLVRAVSGIRADIDPDLLVIEATGLAVPCDMKRNLEAQLGVAARICTVVDASRWRRMLVPLQTLLSQQLNDADLICINKIDLVDTEEIHFIESSVRTFNETACTLTLSVTEHVSDDALERIVGER
ncbi:GTP-binding protein [Raoultibacter phocaeensis]|uniref:GTP-binding protein n=1 Tax=Raoultibacter phocaeensis TaxID=2479841 RepID=UPI00111B6BFB|nr:GTP-binding protein [Raoultibacter phocaeensis]